MHWEIRTSVTRQKIYHKTQLEKQSLFNSFNPYYWGSQTYIHIQIWIKQKRTTDIWITMYLEVLYLLGLNTTWRKHWAHKVWTTNQMCSWFPHSCIYLMLCRHSALLPRFALGSIRSSLHRQDGWWVKQI